MKQVFCSADIGNPSAALCFGNPCATVNWPTTEANARAPWPIPGTFRNLRSKWASSATETMTFRKGGADTALAASVAAGTVGTGTSDVAVAAGDLINLSLTAGSPVVDFVSIEFESSNARESGYINSPNGPSVSDTRYQPLFRANVNWSGAITVPHQQNVVGVAGTVDAIYWHVSVAPGSGKSWLFTIYLNGVAQDGTGGTPDTRVTIADTATQNNGSFSLDLVVGDLVSVEAVPSGTPAGSGSMNVSWGVAFTADVNGYSQFCGQSSSSLNNSVTAYGQPSDMNSQAWATTESDNENEAGLTAFELGGLVLALANAPSAGKSFTFTGRVNSATPSGSASVLIADTATTGSDSGTMTVSPNDTFALQCVPSGTPTAGGSAWAFGQYIAPPAIAGSLVAGVKTTIKSTRSIAFGLDDNTNVLEEDGTFKVFGKTKFGGGALGTGAVTSHGTRLERNTSGNGAAATLQLVAADGTVYYLWVDATGDVRIHSAAPTEDGTTVSDTAGTVVGAQS